MIRVWRIFRSARTGRFITKTEADADPDRTVAETVEDTDTDQDDSSEAS